MRPIKLNPVFKDNLWGGDRLRTHYNKHTAITPLAESWELACHKDGTSTLAQGGGTLTEYLAQHPAAVGTRGAAFAYFPVLFKLIDAKQELSLQVHPNDDYALRVEGEYGKTEMWVILECQPEAKLIFGFRQDITKEEMRRRIENNTLLEVVNLVPVQPGDVFFIPAGTLHAIGKGIVIAELQQNSNTTYRVYDYGRLGADGKPRALHLEKALEVTDTAAYQAVPQNRQKTTVGDCQMEQLAACAYFNAQRLTLAGECTLCAGEESFTGLFCAEGTVTVAAREGTVVLTKGETAFLPAGMGEYTLRGTAELLAMGV